ncbi:hypothetical protein [Ornithinicoccus halotolerans]|uniref:hypothetical protein n=1 Tax=Ornithinicoccus halotolerans TaxID=1748220 RepID=UPI001295E7D4|nr:hypothetical protein [Ornithinicoccus halotolerans]
MAEQPQHEPPRAGHGSVEEEAHRLVRAAADWWQAQDGQSAGAWAATADAEPAGHEKGPEATCTGCPWCRAKAALGPVGADTLLGVADLLGSAADSLRAYARSQGAGDPQQDAGHRPGAGSSEHPPETDGVEQPGGQP